MIILLLALILTLSAGIGSIVVVHLLLILEARGLAVAVAVSIGTLFGPAQVGARVIEGLFGARYHPIWTMVASCAGDGARSGRHDDGRRCRGAYPRR